MARLLSEAFHVDKASCHRGKNDTGVPSSDFCLFHKVVDGGRVASSTDDEVEDSARSILMFIHGVLARASCRSLTRGCVPRLVVLNRS